MSAFKIQVSLIESAFQCSCGHGTQAINQSPKSVNEWRIRMFIPTDMDSRKKGVVMRRADSKHYLVIKLRPPWEISVCMIELEISLFTALMGKWYLPRRFLHSHRSRLDDTKKLIKDAKDFTSSSLYSQTRRYKHSHIFCYKHAYINYTGIGRHLCCVKTQLENNPLSALFLWLVEPRLGWLFVFKDNYRTRDLHRFLVASYSLM